LHLAGQQAVERSAYEEATAYLTRGLELVETLTENFQRDHQELLLQITLSQALTGTKGFVAPEVANAVVRARELCQRVGETPQLFPVLAGLYSLFVVRADLHRAHELGEEVLSLAQCPENRSFLSLGHLMLGQMMYFSGEPNQAREHLEKVLTLYNPEDRRARAPLLGADTEVYGRAYMGRVLWVLGYPDEALKRCDEALTLARELSHPFGLAIALHFSCFTHHRRQEPQAARQRAEELLALSNEHGLQFWITSGDLIRGWALTHEGQGDEGIVQARKGVDGLRLKGGADLGLAYYLIILAETYMKAGRTEDGLPLMAEASEVINKTGQWVYESYLLRTKGELLRALSGNNYVEAEGCFRKATEFAHRQSARSHELQAATSLSRLWQEQGKKEEARQLLADVYDWFTEGFDTCDLKEAKALLDELGR
jgi:predicted ATPase